MKEGTAYATVSVLAASILWGTTGTVAALTPRVGPLAVGAAAMGVGGLLQAASAQRLLRAHRSALFAQWRTVLVSGIAVGAFPLAFYTSMRLAGVAVGTVVSIGSAPIAAALIERIVDRQPLSRRWILGATAGVLGIVALSFAHTAESKPEHGFGAHPLAGIALALLAGVAYALYSWGAARVMRYDLPPGPAMGAIFGVGGILLVPVLLVTGAPIIATWHDTAAMAYLATVPMFMGYLLFGRGLGTIRASSATTLSLLEPAVAAALAVIVLHERLAPVGWTGMAMLLTSLVVVTMDTTRSPSRSSEPTRRVRSGEAG